MASAREHYVYAHRKPSDRTVFYIGKGKGKRAWSMSNRNRRWNFIVSKHGFEVEILKDRLPEPCALSLETAIIVSIGVDRLANYVLGGAGTTGWKHSEEAKRRIGAAFKGRVLTQAQRAALDATRHLPRSDQHRLAMSRAARLRARQPHSAETRAKISASHKGIRPSTEALAKMRAAKVGKAVGAQSPSYDHTIRTFTHPEFGDFAGTRAELIACHGLAHGCISTLINGRRRSVKGWRLK